MASQSVHFYSEKFVEHLESPRHIVVDGGPGFVPNGESLIKGHVAGSFLQMWIEIAPSACITRIAWKTVAMPYVVATTSAMAEWIAGPHGEQDGARLDAALELRPDFVADLVGGLPGRKIHETVFGPRIPKLAIHDHFLRMGLGAPEHPAPEHPSYQPPGGCLPAFAARVREQHASARGGPADAIPETECAVCEAYGPGIHRWLELRRRRSERIF